MPGNSDTRASDGREGTYLLVLPWELQAVGGVNQVVVGLYEGVHKFSRLQPRVLEITWDAPAPLDSIDEAGRRVTRFRMRSPFGSRSWLRDLTRYLLLLPYELLRIRRLARRHDVRVVNCHYIGGADFSWVLARRLGLFRGKVLLSLHGLDIRTLAAARGIKRRLWSWVLRRADAIVACSKGLADETMREFGLSSTQVVTIHNGIDAQRLNAGAVAAAEPQAAGDRGPVLLNLGTLEHKKGHDVLLRAFAEVTRRHPTAHLQIMGRDGETKAATLALIDQLNLGSHVSLTTNVPHHVALRALGAADVFVLSSRDEAFSVALLEAGALAKPVVATNVCGVPELIQDGVTGLLVPSDNPRELAAGMLAMLEDRQRAAEYGRRLHQRVAASFTADSTSRSYLALAGYLAA